MTKGAFTKLWVSTLITLVLLVTGVSLVAYWPIKANPPEDTQKDAPINFGAGGELTTYIDISDILRLENKVLVPNTLEEIGTHETKEVKFSLTLIWTEHENSKGSSEGVSFIGDLEFSHEVLNLDESVKYLIEVNPQVSGDYINFKEEKSVTIVITLIEPKNKEEYDLIKGKEIKISLTVKITNPRENN